MALKVPRGGGPNLFKDGYTFSSGIDEAVLRNLEACTQLADTVRSSFGPNGRNKMVIKYVGPLIPRADRAATSSGSS